MDVSLMKFRTRKKIGRKHFAAIESTHTNEAHWFCYLRSWTIPRVDIIEAENETAARIESRNKQMKSEANRMFSFFLAVWAQWSVSH